MKQLPCTPAQWLAEIRLAIADASEAKLFSPPEDTVTDDNLFHLAPLVCLKFRGRKRDGAEASRVTEVALANHVANSTGEATGHGVNEKPMLAFAVCYVAAHLALDLLDEQQADAILAYCENHLDQG